MTNPTAIPSELTPDTPRYVFYKNQAREVECVQPSALPPHAHLYKLRPLVGSTEVDLVEPDLCVPLTQDDELIIKVTTSLQDMTDDELRAAMSAAEKINVKDDRKITTDAATRKRSEKTAQKKVNALAMAAALGIDVTELENK